MKRRAAPKFAPAVPFVITVFVVFVGVVVYTYFMNINTNVASTPDSHPTTVAKNTTIAKPADVPKISNTADLDVMLQSIDNTPVDTSNADMAAVNSSSANF